MAPEEAKKSIEEKINNAVLSALDHVDDLLIEIGADQQVVEGFKKSVADIATSVTSFGITQLENLVIKNLGK